MPLSLTRLGGVGGPAGDWASYRVPTGRSVRITKVVIPNTGSTTEQAWIAINQDSNSANIDTETDIVVNNVDIFPNDALILDGDWFLAPGDYLWAKRSSVTLVFNFFAGVGA